MDDNKEWLFLQTSLQCLMSRSTTRFCESGPRLDFSFFIFLLIIYSSIWCHNYCFISKDMELVSCQNTHILLLWNNVTLTSPFVWKHSELFRFFYPFTNFVMGNCDHFCLSVYLSVCHFVRRHDNSSTNHPILI